MLIFDFYMIGNKLHEFRKRMGYTQAEIAEKSGISDRTYADIERGTVNMRVETLLRICNALHITPDEILTTKEPANSMDSDTLYEKLNLCSSQDKETALKLLSVFLQSLQ